MRRSRQSRREATLVVVGMLGVVVVLAVQAGAAIQVPDPIALAREAERLLRDPHAAQRMSQAAIAFASAHRGATARVLELISLQDPVIK